METIMTALIGAFTIGATIHSIWIMINSTNYSHVNDDDSEDVPEFEFPPAKRTLLDFCIIGGSLLNAVVSMPFRKEDIDLGVIISFCWLFHTFHLLSFDRQKSPAIRHFFVLYSIVLLYRIYVIRFTIDWSSAWAVTMNLLPVALSGLMVVLDLYKPALNSDLINRTLIGKRFPSPEVTASPADIISFGWVLGLMEKGYKTALEDEDLPDLRVEDKSAKIVGKWRLFREKSSSSNSVLYDLLFFSLYSLVLALMTAFIFVILEFANPLFINLLIKLMQAPRDNSTVGDGVCILIGLLFSNIFKQIVKSQNILLCRKWGYQIRSILINEIFIKSLRRVSKSSTKTLEKENAPASIGKIVSLMSSDVTSIRNYFLNIDMLLIDVPVSTFMSISGLLYLMGPSALSGLVVILISGPCTSWALSRLYKSQREVRTKKDKRIQITNETFLGIRIIKYMAWEESFYKKMAEARISEIQCIWDRIYDFVLVSIIGSGSSILITFISFFFYTVVAGNKLDAATAFSSITLMAQMNQTLNGLGSKVAKFLDVRINVERIYNFLQEEEVLNMNENVVNHEKIGLFNASFEYHSHSSPMPTESTTDTTPLLSDSESLSSSFTLRNVTADFPKGELSVVIGKTGAGKTSLALALLGEMHQLSGSRFMPLQRNQIAFCPQTPWLINSTIRENVLFGLEYDPQRYLSAIKACQLLKDLDQLEYGDLTEIGEKGVNLSGGQKARISLARACYSKAKVVLLDDPLSAVDAPTARALLNHCILDLLKGRTIILITHAVSITFPVADYVVVLDNGAITMSGPPQQVSQALSIDELPIKDIYQSVSEELPLKSIPQTSNTEGKAVGRVKSKTYRSYIAAAGGVGFGFAMLATFLLSTGSQYLNRWWITVWTDSDPSAMNPTFFLVVFGLIGVGDIVTSLARLFFTYIAGLRAAQSIHDGLAQSILGSPMRFFEITPVGRIINRFDKDMGSIDSEVMSAFVAYCSVIVGAVLRIIIVAFVTPSFLVMLFLLVIYYKLAKFYLASSRELKRINSVSISPIFGLFGEVLLGVGSIRAYDAQSQFEQKIQQRLDANHRADFYLFATNRFLQFRTAILSSLIVFIAGCSVLFSNLSAGWAGLTLSFASSITSQLSGLVWSQSALELSMNAVERIDEYSRLPQEKIEEEIFPPAGWPTQGKVEVKELKVRYSSELPLVLKGISFSVEPRQKVAVVGRTGAGKSTLSLAFWRILEYEGLITIDDVDISKLGVRALRKEMTIVPQEPILFEGTVRSNLDPNGEHDDAQLWDALRSTAFTETLQDNQDFSLDFDVSMNGNNFSQGQKQLICLARALLRSSKLLFLDEASSSVDHTTDALIQQTIRKCFSNSTIVTVAHRLRTIIDYDMVIVMQNGDIIESGSPRELVDRGQEFYFMLKESGDLEELVQMIGAP